MGLWIMHAIDSQAPASNWNSDNGQVNVNNDNVGNSDDNIGARLPVRGILKSSILVGWLSKTFEPAASHSAHFTRKSLHLKDFGFTHKLQIKIKTQLKTEYFKLGTSAEQESNFLCFGRMLCFNKLFEQFK